jgi:4-carboxymuconolactone decarboxylase
MTSPSNTRSEQAEDPPSFVLRGNRFKPLTWAVMSQEQKDMTRSVLGGKRANMQGPYNVLLHSPEVGQLAQEFGAHTRFNSSLPLALNELAILMVARDWTSQFVWWAHKQIATQEGVPHDLINAIATQSPPPANLSADLELVYHFCSELIQTRVVSDLTFERARSLFKERGVVDLMATMSYYTLVCMSLNVDGYPLPDGVKPELGPKN